MTIITNILVAYLVIPALANGPDKQIETETNQLVFTSIEVQIPCPGHAPLIIDELNKIYGIKKVSFKTPRTFGITYNTKETSLENIKTAEIFKSFKIISN